VSINIFISSGTPYTKKQEKFLDDVEKILTNNDFTSRTAGRNCFSIEQPIKFVNELIRSCSGAVIIAFKRIKISKGIEKPNSSEQKDIENIYLPTIWNQLEAAMAYGNNLPLLIIAEKGLKPEGMLSKRLEWYIQEIEIEPENLESKEFKGRFESWKDQVIKHENKSNKILSKFKDNKLWTIISTLVASMSLIATLAYYAGLASSK